MSYKFGDYPGDPPEPTLKLARAPQAGTCAGCGEPYEEGEICDISEIADGKLQVYCNACVESEQPGATADFLDPCSHEGDGADWPDIEIDDATFIDYPADCGPITYGSLNREEPDHDEPDEEEAPHD